MRSAPSSIRPWYRLRRISAQASVAVPDGVALAGLIRRCRRYLCLIDEWSRVWFHDLAALKNAVAFAEFKGYEAWQVIAPSQPDNEGGCGLDWVHGWLDGHG